MADQVFRIVEHQIPCQHIREYAHAIDGEQETELLLAVKQYIPLSNPNPGYGDITIIGAHATGFGKVKPSREIARQLSDESRSAMSHYGKILFKS